MKQNNPDASKLKCVILSCVVVFVMLVSFFSPLEELSSPLFGGKELRQNLEKKNVQTMMLFSGATAASIAVSLLPGDIGSAISEKLADAACFFLLVTGAVTLEKIMLSLSGLLFFKIVIPISLVLLLIYIWKNHIFLFALFCKFFLSGIIFLIAMPASLVVSNIVENKLLYSGANSETIDAAINAINNNTEAIDKTEEVISNDEKAKNWWDVPGKIKDTVSDVSTWIGRQAREALQKAEDSLKTLSTALVNMIIIVCAIPLITILGFAMLFKALWKIDNKKFILTDK